MQLPHYEKEGHVDGLVEEVVELEVDLKRGRCWDVMGRHEVLAMQLPHYEKEGHVDGLVEEVVELEVDLVIRNHAMVEGGHAAYTDRFYELARLAPHLVTPGNKRIERYIYGLALQIQGIVAATEPVTIQRAIEKAGTMTDEAVRNGSLKKNPEKRGSSGEPNRDRNARDENKMTRTVNAFSTTTNPVRREYNDTIPKCDSVASGQLVEINKFIIGCKLEIEGHMFDINLIPFGSGSFDVIIGVDWLSNHKAEIIYHEKVVRIPLQDGQVLRVIVERPEDKIRHLMSAKANEQKQEEIVVVRDFIEVFLDYLLGLLPIQEIEFCIELIPKAISIAKSPYRLALSEMKELTREEHDMHLGLVLELLKKEKMEQEKAFQTSKDKLCNAPVLALPDELEDFVVYCVASGLGLGCVLMQRG
nr:putative reverse transcriptase domain-containing protein [Tanacetum cinerariifolium]